MLATSGMVCLGFWTAGVDVQTRAQFKWEQTGEAIVSNLPFNSFVGPYTCLFYHLVGAVNHLHSILCSSTTLFTLCEAV